VQLRDLVTLPAGRQVCGKKNTFQSGLIFYLLSPPKRDFGCASTFYFYLLSFVLLDVAKKLPPE
jgi:hypothetical protein